MKCNTDLCRQGRSPCPTPSACSGLRQTEGGLQVDTRANCVTPIRMRPVEHHHSGGLFGLNDAPTEGGTRRTFWDTLAWAFLAISLTVAVSSAFPWGFAAW